MIDETSQVQIATYIFPSTVEPLNPDCKAATATTATTKNATVGNTIVRVKLTFTFYNEFRHQLIQISLPCYVRLE